MESPISGGAEVFQQDQFIQKGKLIASTAQEGLMRLWKKSK